jgi:hypothetical protein
MSHDSRLLYTFKNLHKIVNEKLNWQSFIHKCGQSKNLIEKFHFRLTTGYKSWLKHLHRTAARSSLEVHSVQTMKSEKTLHMSSPTSGGNMLGSVTSCRAQCNKNNINLIIELTGRGQL